MSGRIYGFLLSHGMTPVAIAAWRLLVLATPTIVALVVAQANLVTLLAAGLVGQFDEAALLWLLSGSGTATVIMVVSRRAAEVGAAAFGFLTIRAAIGLVLTDYALGTLLFTGNLLAAVLCFRAASRAPGSDGQDSDKTCSSRVNQRVR